MDTNLVNLTKAAKDLHVDYTTLWRWIKKGDVIPIRFLGMPFLSSEQIAALKKRREVTNGPSKAV